MTSSDLDKELLAVMEEGHEWRAVGAAVNVEPGSSMFISNDLL